MVLPSQEFGSYDGVQDHEQIGTTFEVAPSWTLCSSSGWVTTSKATNKIHTPCNSNGYYVFVLTIPCFDALLANILHYPQNINLWT